MNPFDVNLPKDQQGLEFLYLLINKRLDNIWSEYTNHAEQLQVMPDTSSIFPILFSELDFYEALLERVRAKIPRETLHELRCKHYISDW